MTDIYYEKDVMDCTNGELEKYLVKKAGYQLHQLRLLSRRNLIEAVEDLLQAQGRTKIIFRPPKNIIGRSFFRMRHRLSGRKSSQKDQVPTDTRSEPTTMEFIHGNRSDILTADMSIVTEEPTAPSHVSSGQKFPENRPTYQTAPHHHFSTPHPNRPNRPPPINPRFLPDDSPIQVGRNPADPIIVTPPVLQKSDNQFMSKIEPAKTVQQLEPENYTENYVSAGFSRSESKLKTKFTTIYDDAKMTIEDYLKACDRWRRTNETSDDKAVLQALGNFKDVGLANNLEEHLSEGALQDFDIFVAEVKHKLGKTQNQWLTNYENLRREKHETPFQLLSKLSANLKLGLGISRLTTGHEAMLTQKFLTLVHPALRGHLLARETPITYDNLAEQAQQIELAHRIPRIKPVMMNEIQNTQKEPPKQVRFDKNRTEKVCTFCQRPYHEADRCWFNPHSKDFRPHYSRQNDTKNNTKN